LKQEQPLDGMLVVGLEQSVAGPLCTRILGDMGATVIKVERPPLGDFARRWDDNVHGECAQFWWLNRRKQSVALDLKSDEGRAVFERLLDKADALVANLSPAALTRLSLTRTLVTERYPALVTCVISGYGERGEFRDRKAYDMLIQAEAGVMSLTGSPEQPTRVGVSIADVGTGVYAAALVAGALVGRVRNGTGAYLDVAMFDATVEFAGPMLLSYLNAGVLYPRLPDRHHAIAPYGVFRCADGARLLVAVQNDAEWRVFAERVVGRPELADDARYATSVARLANRPEVDDFAARAIAALTRTQATELLDEIRIAYGSVNDIGDVANHPVTAELGLLKDVDMADGGTAHTMVGIAERLFGSGSSERERPPAIGEDTESVLGSLGAVPQPR
jgi:itaconate CoA-transferase